MMSLVSMFVRALSVPSALQPLIDVHSDSMAFNVFACILFRENLCSFQELGGGTGIMRGRVQ